MSGRDSESEPDSSTGATSASRSVLGIFGTRLLIYPISFVVSVLVARILGAEDRGIYQFLLLLEGTILPLMYFGCEAAITYQIGSEAYQPQRTLVTSILLGTFFGSITAALVGSLWYNAFLGRTGNQIPPEAILPILIALPLRGAYLAINRVVTGCSWFGLMNVMTLTKRTLVVVLLVFLVVLAGLGLEGAAWAIASATILQVLVFGAAVLRRVRPELVVDFRYVRDVLSYGVRAWAGSLAARTNKRLDQILVSVFAPAAGLGNYAIAVQLSELIWVPMDALSPVLFNKLSAMRDRAKEVALTEHAHRTILAIAVILGLGLLLSWWLVPVVYGSDYADAVLPLMILVPGSIIMLTFRVLTKFLSGSGHPEKASIAQVAGTAASVVLYFTLIPRWGIVGAALATSVTYLVVSAAALVQYRRMVRPLESRLFRIRVSDLSWGITRVKAALAGLLGRT